MGRYKEIIDCIQEYDISKSSNLLLAYSCINRHLQTNIGPIYKYNIETGCFEGKFHPLSNEWKNKQSAPDLADLCENKGGIYIVFENSEQYNGFNRIVRVGRALTKLTLIKRLKQHFCPTSNFPKDNSIFRKHIGRALLIEENKTESFIKNNWNKKKTTVDRLEGKITERLAKNFSFCVIPLDNEDEIKNLEKALITLLSTYNVLYKDLHTQPIPSNNWLGKKCTNKRVQTSGLWNYEFVVTK